ncbi:MAG: TIR domain-containing protein [Sphingomicrobium sp.]
MTDVFVSYKAEDRARIAPLVRALETGGVSVWWDAHIGGGEEWRQTILRHLEAAKCVIVVWSKRSVGPNGEFVRDEAARAQKRKTYLPVRIDKVDPPLGFGEMQALDLTGWKGDTSDPRYEAVVTALRSRFGIKAKKARTSSAEQQGVDRRALIAVGSVTAIAIAGGGAWFLARPAAAKSNSIAVMPFENLSGDPSQTYFSDGIAEELRGDLSHVADLQVIARTSSEAMRNADAKTAAAKLGVVNILTGSVRRSPTMIRISAQLVDGRNGVERWSQTYDRAPGDSLQIQTDIASKVADALKLQLGDAVSDVLAEGGTRNAAAQDLLLQARAVARRDDSDAGSQQVIGLLDSALTLDPRYGDALAMKAGTVTAMADEPSTLAERSRRFSEGEQLARQAIAFAPRSFDARSVLAANLFFQFKMKDAFQQAGFMRSLLARSSGASYDVYDINNYLLMLQAIGEYAQTVTLAERMVASDPLNPWSYHAKAQALYYLHRYPEAETSERQAIALAPDLAWPRSWHGLILMQMGKFDQAKIEFAKAHDNAQSMVWEAILYEREGNRAESNRLLKEIQQRAGDAAHYQYAEVLAQQHRTDEAIAELEKAWSNRDDGLTGLNTDEMLDPIRNDPRFQAIVRRMNFPA